MEPGQILDWCLSSLDGTVLVDSWGERVGGVAYKDRGPHGTREAQGPLHSKGRAEKEDPQLARERSETGREQRKTVPKMQRSKQ